MSACHETNEPFAPIGDADFWNLHDVEDSYWDDYTATRPVYDGTLMDRVFQFHEEHTSSFDTAVDIGCGAGSGVKALLSRFRHVIASDNDPKSLCVANRKLAHLAKSRVTYILSTGETIDQHCALQSIDLVASAECFPALDTHETLDAIHKILRPNGTLAIWFYGRINFTEPDFRPRCQPILDTILDTAFKRVVSGCGSERKHAWKRAADGMSSWLDYIPFDPARWYDVHRHKWNPDMTLPFFGPNACDFEITAETNVLESEVITTETNAEFWRMDLDIVGMRRFIAAAFPWPVGIASPTSEMEQLFGDLEIAMGGHSAQRKFSWPASLILASKRA